MEHMTGRLIRVTPGAAPPVRLSVDGRTIEAVGGDSVLVAILTSQGQLRRHEFSGEPRAGFCLMGACQDCWVWMADGTRARACTTAVADGMQVLTGPPHRFP
jgi:D-hydroxyproline dehydrogenase subunit gamma